MQSPSDRTSPSLRPDRRALFCVAVIAGVIAAAVAAPAPATAAESSVMLLPASGPSGTKVELRGARFAGQRVRVKIGSRIVARDRTGRGGKFTAQFKVPKGKARKLSVWSTNGKRPIKNIFRYARSKTAYSGEIATGRRRRLRWSPTAALAGSTFHLSGSKLPAKRQVRITVGGKPAVSGRTNRRGRFSRDILVPRLKVGRHVVVVKAGRVRFAFPFTVPQPPPGPRPPRVSPISDPLVVAAGDIACDPTNRNFHNGRGDATHCRQMHTSNIAMRPRPAAVLPLGDLQYEVGAFDDFRRSYDPSWGRLKSLTRPAIGNSEYGVPGAAGYFDYFNGVGNETGPAGPRSTGYYSYDVGAWHLIALNSTCSKLPGGCSAGSPQERWLRADLAAHPRACTLAYWHHPRFSSGRYGDNPNLRAFWQALYDYGAEIVLNGHDQNYQRYARQDPDGFVTSRGLREFVVGTGGRSQLAIQPGAVANREAASGTTFGVLKLTLHPTSYDWRFSSGGGPFSDAGSGICH